MQSVFINMSRLVNFVSFFSNFSLGFEMILPSHVLFGTSDTDFMDICTIVIITIQSFNIFIRLAMFLLSHPYLDNLIDTQKRFMRHSYRETCNDPKSYSYCTLHYNG
jgi:hypothetical protein